MGNSVSSAAISATLSSAEVSGEAAANAMRLWREQSPTLVSIRDVCAMTSLSRTFINRRREEGQFPEPVPLGDRRIGFVRSEVEQWIAERIANRSAAQTPGRS